MSTRRSTSAGSARREELLASGAEMLRAATLEQFLSFIGVRSISRATGRSLGMISHHFPKSELISRQVAEYSLNQIEFMANEQLEAGITAALAGVNPDDPQSFEPVLAALIDELSNYSPEDPANYDEAFDTEEVAFWVTCAAAPHDAVARQILDDFAMPRIERVTELCRQAAQLLGRSTERTDEVAAVINALAVGFACVRRFRAPPPPLSLYANAVATLFNDATADPTRDHSEVRDEIFSSIRARTSTDPAKRANILDIARELCLSRTWADVTMLKVAEYSEVSRPTIAASFGDRDGLGAAVWLSIFVPQLQAGAQRDINRQCSPAERLRTIIDRLVRFARQDRALTRSLLAASLVRQPEMADESGQCDGELSTSAAITDRAICATVLRPVISLVRSSLRATQTAPANTPEAERDELSLVELLVVSALHLATSPGERDEEEISDLILGLAATERPRRIL